MGDNVKFKEWQCHDDRPVICQETALGRVLGFAGIHDVDTETDISELFTTGALSDFNLEDSEGTWSITGAALQGVGGGAARWYKVRHTTEIEPGFVATFDKTGNKGAFLICSDDDYDGYLVWWTDAAVGVSDINETTETVLVSLPMAEAGAASVTIGVWLRSYTSIDEIDDMIVMLWFDNKHLLTYTLEYEEKGKKVGFAVYQSDTITFDNLRIAQLHQIVEWTSVDPGETASAGFSRVVAYEEIKARARYDGAVHIWREEGNTVDWAIPAGRYLSLTKEQQIFWPSHLRLVGAIHEVDKFRDETQGHVFAVGSDPNALTEDETADRATRRHEKIEEQAYGVSAVLAPNPALEPEDVITIDGETLRVGAISYRAAWRGGVGSGAPVLESNLRFRECL